jgi:hypothetical protein
MDTEINSFPPDWVKKAAQALSPSAGFEDRCVDASLAAYTIAKLAEVREACEFAPITMRQYLLSLAKRAGVELDPLLRWANLPSILAATEDTAATLGAVVRAIGGRIEIAQILIRLSWAKQIGINTPAMLVAYRGRVDKMDEFVLCSQVLDEAEAAYSEAERRALRAMLGSVRDVFQERG